MSEDGLYHCRAALPSAVALRGYMNWDCAPRVDGQVDDTDPISCSPASTARTLATKLYRHHDRSKWPRSAAVRRSDNDLRDSASSVC